MVKITVKKDKAWVTFTYSKPEITECKLSGSWSNWKHEVMKQKKSGEFYLRKVLPLGNSYEFGYITDNNEWACDDECGCVASPFGSNNSLLEL